MRAETSQHSNARHALKALQLVSRMMTPKRRSCCSGMQIASRRFASPRKVDSSTGGWRRRVGIRQPRRSRVGRQPLGILKHEGNEWMRRSAGQFIVQRATGDASLENGVFGDGEKEWQGAGGSR